MASKNRARILACLLALFAADAFSHSATWADERPNIVFFLADDQRFDQLGCAGHPILQTPNIDRLAAEGTRFRNAFVTTSICAASRATIFTGLYERSHKYTFGTPPLDGSMTDASYPTLLRAAGYRTGFIGKFGVGVQQGAQQQMFDYFRPLNRSPYFKDQPDGSKRHITDICGDLAAEFLEQQSDQAPFCLSISFNAPHAEDNDKQNHYPWPPGMDGLYDDIHVPPPRLSEPEVFASQPEFLKQSLNRQRWYWRWDTPEKWQKNIKGYYRMISGIDHVVGRVVEQLRRRGLADNTIIVYAADNGYYLGQRGFAGKWSHYEESLRIPIIVFDPRSDARPSIVDAMALNVDIPATLLDAAGVSLPDSYQGQSLVPWTRGQQPDRWRSDFFVEHLMHYPGGIPKWEGVRDQRWVYARYFEQQPAFEFLHDLQNDPDQLQNLAASDQHRQALAQMRDRCDQLRDSYGGPYNEQQFPNNRRERTNEPTASEPNRPNVVMIISDDQAWTDYGFMGHDVIQTPHLDRLSRAGATFPRGYVPTSLCRPSLATMITGLYPSQHKISGNDPAWQGASGRAARRDPQYRQLSEQLISHIEQVPTLPRLLDQAGYLSFQSGKWWEGNFKRGGFTHGMTHGDPARGGRHGDEGLAIGRDDMQPVFDFIDRAGQRPFFLWYAPFLPHTPHHPPQRLIDKYAAPDRPEPLVKYYAMCEWFDESCGRLLGYLDTKGLRDNTIVIYVTDNGWIQRTPDTQVPKGWNQSFAPRSKQSPYDGGTRTPIMIRWPGQVTPATHDQLVSSIDLAPTILEACGVEVPESLPGLSLWDACRGQPLKREAIFGESFAHDVADINDPTASLLFRWCIEGKWKLIISYDGAAGRYNVVHATTPLEPQLFDLIADPMETNNLAAEQADVVAQLKQRIVEQFE